MRGQPAMKRQRMMTKHSACKQSGWGRKQAPENLWAFLKWKWLLWFLRHGGLECGLRIRLCLSGLGAVLTPLLSASPGTATGFRWEAIPWEPYATGTPERSSKGG